MCIILFLVQPTPRKNVVEGCTGIERCRLTTKSGKAEEILGCDGDNIICAALKGEKNGM